MANKRLKEDPVNTLKLIAKNMVDGFFDDLMKKDVLNKDELQKLGKGVNLIVNETENLIEDVAEKSQMVGKIFMNYVFNTKKQLCSKSHSEDETDESQDNESSSSSTESSEDESEEDRVEEKTGSAQALALPQTGSGSDSEDDETKKHVGLFQASVLPLTVSQKTQASQANHKLKLCPHDHFHRLMTTKADEIYPVMEKEGRTRLALIIWNKEFNYLSNRHGSEVDLLGMQDLLESLGYSVVVKVNLTALVMTQGSGTSFLPLK